MSMAVPHKFSPACESSGRLLKTQTVGSHPRPSRSEVGMENMHVKFTGDSAATCAGATLCEPLG